MLAMLTKVFACVFMLTAFAAPAAATSDMRGFAPGMKPIVEVAFVLDTTGSMGPLIEGAKRKIWSIATAIIDANPHAEIRMGLVAYRDIGDEYVTKVFNLTTDIQDLYANLLELRARGGGDWPESVNEALEVGVTKLAWTQGSEICRILFLVGDAPPHMDYAQDTKYPDVVRMARKRDIIVNAVQAAARATPSGCGARSPSAATAVTSRSHRTAARSSSSRRRSTTRSSCCKAGSTARSFPMARARSAPAWNARPASMPPRPPRWRRKWPAI
jgi:hypothetical protein